MLLVTIWNERVACCSLNRVDYTQALCSKGVQQSGNSLIIEQENQA